MSWLWGNETTEQAQFVVSALQSELDERESKIKALEAALKREQQDMTALLEDEVKELEVRRQAIQKELASVDNLIREKEKLIQKSKSDKKKKKNKKTKTPVSSPRAAVEEKPQAAVAAKENGRAKEAVASPKVKKKQQKKESVASADAAPAGDSKVLPMDKNL
eukprot:jgi/Phyca11/511665/fgenesh2_kg.PHYCAscaffold_94_\